MLPAISGSKLVESQLLRCVKFIFGEVDLAVALQHILEEVGMDEMSWWHTQKAVIGAWKHYMTEEYTPAKLRAMYSIGAPPSKKAKPTPPPQPHSPLHPPPEVHAGDEVEEVLEEQDKEFVEEQRVGTHAQVVDDDEEEPLQDSVMMEILQDYQLSPTLIQAFFMNLSQREQKRLLRLG